jgi:hypothetical protein
MIKELNIPEENLDKFEKRVNKLNKLSKKLNLVPIEYKITGEHFEKIKEDESDPRQIYFIPDNQIIIVKIFEIELTGELPQIPNWEFVGVIEHQKEMNVIKKMANVEIDKKYYKVGCTCEHCKTNRVRKTTILVKNVKTNEFKQVGKSCLKDYLGHNALECFEWINTVNCLDEFDSSDFIQRMKYFDIESILLMTVNHLKLNNFISGRASMETGEQSTASYINCNYINFNYNRVTEEEKTEVKAIIEFIKNIELTNNDYVNNLVSLCSNRYFDIKNIGYVVSMVPYYEKEMKKIKERELRKNSNISKFVGSIKDKIEKELIYVNCFGYETQWGWNHLFKFIDAENNVYIWSTTKGLIANEGDKIKLKGTIKKHKEYMEEKQTYLTRCKILTDKKVSKEEIKTTEMEKDLDTFLKEITA